MLRGILPWQISAWRQVFAAGERLPHALLLWGPEGLGKLQFARLVAQALLCEQPDPDFYPCEECLSCRWHHQEAHPDLRLLQPDFTATEETEVDSADKAGTGKAKQGGRQISVGQVRELSGFTNLTAHRRGKKVVVVHPAEALNVSAANALLKTLEEPPRDTVFLLVSHRAHRVLPTVRSRCRAVPMRVPAPAESMAWLVEQGVEDPLSGLAAAGFAPLRALENAREGHRERRKIFLGRLANSTLDPIGHAAAHDSGELPQILGWLHKWTYDLVANRLVARTRYNLDFVVPLKRISKQADVVQLGRLYRTLAAYQSRLGHPLNARLVLEHLFLSYRKCVGGDRE